MNPEPIDPRPDWIDTKLWERMFKIILARWGRNKTDRDMNLFWLLYTIRGFGTMLKPTPTLRFVPVLDMQGWDDQEMFEDFKRRYMAEYKTEIAHLLKQLADK